MGDVWPKDNLAFFFSFEGAALELPAGEPYGSPPTLPKCVPPAKTVKQIKQVAGRCLGQPVAPVIRIISVLGPGLQ